MAAGSAIKSGTASALLPAAANLSEANLSEANLSEAAQHTEKTERPPPLVLLNSFVFFSSDHKHVLDRSFRPLLDV